MKEMIFVVLRTTMRVMPLPAIEKTIGKIKTKLHFKSILQSLMRIYMHTFICLYINVFSLNIFSDVIATMTTVVC